MPRSNLSPKPDLSTKRVMSGISQQISRNRNESKPNFRVTYGMMNPISNPEMPMCVNNVIEQWELKLNRKMNLIRMHSHFITNESGFSVSIFNTMKIINKKRTYSKQMTQISSSLAQQKIV